MSQSDNKSLHRFLVNIAALAVRSFYSKVHIIGEENVPKDEPLIVVATHHNMMIDPSILSSYFPQRRCLNYWVKASLFANPILRWVLLKAGNIPVDRTKKDNQVLFKGTFEALGRGEAMAIFPEGTSYTEPRIMQVKYGASWVALEYMKWAEKNPESAVASSVRILPVAIVYTNKSKYRSEVIVDFTSPISVDPLRDQFLKGDETTRRSLAKELTQKLERQLIEATINAPDWDTLYSARMARDLLWEKDKSINLDDFVNISQTLVDLFSTPHVTRNFRETRSCLLEYYSLLHSTRLTNSVLSSLPLPASLDPSRPVRFPSRLFTLVILIRDSLACLIRLPFFLLPLVIHLPAYAVSRVGALLAKDEEETQAQNKIVLSLLILGLIIYPSSFLFLWALGRFTAIGALFAGVLVYLFASYHTKVIDDNYEHAKRLLATWRVLVGVWAPKNWDLSLPALTPYTIPLTPPENPWVKKNKVVSPASTPVTPSISSNNLVESNSTTMAKNASAAPDCAADAMSTSRKKPPRTPSRRLIRHVLRARSKAAFELASFFAQLEKADTSKRVYASPHLAKRFGGGLRVDSTLDDPNSASTSEQKDNNEIGLELDTPISSKTDLGLNLSSSGWRYSREVVCFLRERGAQIPTVNCEVELDWDASSSDGEGGTLMASNSYAENHVQAPPSI